MENMIIGFSKQEKCEAVKEVLITNGFMDISVCLSGAEVLRAANQGGGGVVICGLKLKDMMCYEISDALPLDYGLLVLLSRNQAEMMYRDDIFSLVLPVHKIDLIKTVQMILELTRKGNTEVSHADKKERSKEDTILIERAKLMLMNRYNWTEKAAHRFIQKTSMDTGRKMVDTAKVILKDC